MPLPARVSLALIPFLVAACDKPPEEAAPIRPVRAMAVYHSAANESVTLTGTVQAQNTVNLAFRVGGRLLERNGDVGASVRPGQLIGRLEQLDAQTSIRTAQANLSSAEGTLTQAQADFRRQNDLFNRGFAPRAAFDSAQQRLQAAQAQVDSAQAQVKSARDNLGYTELRAEIAGVVTAKGAEPGEVVQAGQMILQVARQGGRDAVFNVPAQTIRNAPPDITVTVALADDPRITVQAKVREVSPTADAATGTYAVKVGLIDPPPAMRLGATVSGTARLSNESLIQLPATALTERGGKTAVWVVDAARTVQTRPVAVARYAPNAVLIADGLKDGEMVVTAGVQALHPGQRVRLLETADRRP